MTQKGGKKHTMSRLEVHLLTISLSLSHFVIEEIFNKVKNYKTKQKKIVKKENTEKKRKGK